MPTPPSRGGFDHALLGTGDPGAFVTRRGACPATAKENEHE